VYFSSFFVQYQSSIINFTLPVVGRRLMLWHLRVHIFKNATDSCGYDFVHMFENSSIFLWHDFMTFEFCIFLVTDAAMLSTNLFSTLAKQ
jgi:hypothetical protein